MRQPPVPSEAVGVAVRCWWRWLSTTGAGGVFAWLRLWSHSVLAPVLAHAAVNMSACLAGRRLVDRNLATPPPPVIRSGR